jgi:hypothetical protein
MGHAVAHWRTRGVASFHTSSSSAQLVLDPLVARRVGAGSGQPSESFYNSPAILGLTESKGHQLSTQAAARKGGFLLLLLVDLGGRLLMVSGGRVLVGRVVELLRVCR